MTIPANGGNGDGAGAGDGGDGGAGAGGQNQQQNQQQQNGGGDGGQQQQQQNNGGGVQLTEEQLTAAFQHPRFKELNEKAKLADKLKSDQDAAEAKRLQEQGQFEELAKKHQADAETAQAALKTERINNAVIVAASKLGAHDTSVVTKLVDSGAITVDGDGKISGVEEALKTLQASNPYLFKTGSQANIGGGDTNSNGGNANDATYSLSQFKDSTFYAAHAKEMDAAMTAGKVDMTR